MVGSLIRVHCPFCKAGIGDAEEVDGRPVIRQASVNRDQQGTFLTCPSCSRRVIVESAKAGGFRVSEFQNRNEWG